MKTLSFAVLFAVSATFLSCSTDEDDVRDCVKAAKLNYEDIEDIDPSCKSEQKKLVSIIDLSPREIDWDYVYSHLPGYVPGSGYVPETGGVTGSGPAYYNVNGIEMTQEEYEVYNREYWRKYGEELSKSKRDLPIPCIVGDGIALLTDEEIAELMETYGELAIEEYHEPVPGYIVSGYNENTRETYCKE